MELKISTTTTVEFVCRRHGTLVFDTVADALSASKSHRFCLPYNGSRSIKLNDKKNELYINVLFDKHKGLSRKEIGQKYQIRPQTITDIIGRFRKQGYLISQKGRILQMPDGRTQIDIPQRYQE
ncbi:MAG: helix-turn-helix domain containing protein [Candidatus Ancillula sp.]|jgi:predicted DNA-binding protein YlxM (UPF0122 family)|nr:helix-turn-helix domain containing protein [Candidatus Ancillula sp.]